MRRLFHAAPRPAPERTCFLLLHALLAALILFAFACGDDEETSPALGESCNPAKGADACKNDEAVCEPDLNPQADPEKNVCQMALGATCDPDAKDPFCTEGASCYAFADPDDASKTIHMCATDRGAECDMDHPVCAPDMICADITDGSARCYEPIVLRGKVFDALDTSSIEGAHVIALNDVFVAVSDVATTDEAGNYELSVPAVRDDQGAPLSETSYTLRVNALDYQAFPSGIRQAIPILASEATSAGEGDAWVIESTLTEVALIPLPGGETRYAISGHVVTTDSDQDGIDDEGAGVLVVAHGGVSPAPTAISDLGGTYTIFNVTNGAFEVKGYKAGLELETESVTVASADLTDVDLGLVSDHPGDVTGSISIVNAPGGSFTSVVLAVEDTFLDSFGRGEVPAGMRTPLNIQNTWIIEGVPAGRYVVLAAFENDDLVRDPDQNIAGTATVIIEVVAGQNLDISDTFKVTEALDVFGPGADLPTGVSAPPMLTWQDDSSEDYYTVQVFNALGDMVWEDPSVPSVSGSEQVSVSYGGPMVSGMYYQFRAKSWRLPGGQNASPISATEDLCGVFFFE